MFFALWPEPTIRTRLAALLPGLAEAGRPVAADNLHLTLAFLGPTSARQQACMETWAAGLSCPAFTLELNHYGHWPGPRVAWLAPEQWPEALGELAAALAEGMRHCGLVPDPRPYRPHITLLRKARVLPEGLPELHIPWQIQGFVLCESCSSAQGVEYRVLRRFGLFPESPSM